MRDLVRRQVSPSLLMTMMRVRVMLLPELLMKKRRRKKKRKKMNKSNPKLKTRKLFKLIGSFKT